MKPGAYDNNSNVWNVTFIFLYSTELLCINLKTNLSNTVVCTAVWQCDCVKPMRIGLIKTLRKTTKKKKKKKEKNNNNKTKLCVVPRHLPDVHKENQHPMGKEESH